MLGTGCLEQVGAVGRESPWHRTTGQDFAGKTGEGALFDRQ